LSFIEIVGGQKKTPEIVENVSRAVKTGIEPFGDASGLDRSPVIPKIKRNPAITEDFGLNSDIITLIYEWSEFYHYSDTRKASAIVSCEGGNNSSVCNQKYGCGSGMGHFQFITSTWNSICRDVLGLTDIYNSSQNIRCGIYTLKTYGDQHWGMLTTEWGSARCWKPKL